MSRKAKAYSNFVKASDSGCTSNTNLAVVTVTGDEAKKMYLEEIKGAHSSRRDLAEVVMHPKSRSAMSDDVILSDKDLFVAVENNDHLAVQKVLRIHPEKVNLKDEYGWSLLMIACQANSVEVVQELLNNNADTSVRDKADNTAQSLVLKNRNAVLAGILLSSKRDSKVKTLSTPASNRKRKNKDYKCETCGNSYPYKEEHLSSTIHNINASKGKKIRSSYKIPLTNKGFQIMLKSGWDKDSGLGTSGDGRRYPIKTKQKTDRKGLGNETSKCKTQITVINQEAKRNSNKHKMMEIDFRRQFY